MIVPVRVQPAVAVLPLCVRYPQVPGQVSEQQAVQQAPHPGGFLRSGGVSYRTASVGVICSTWRSICNQRNFRLRHCHRSFPHSLKTKPLQPADWENPTGFSLYATLVSALTSDPKHAGLTPRCPPDVLLPLLLSARLCAQLRGEAAFVTPALCAPPSPEKRACAFTAQRCADAL